MWRQVWYLSGLTAIILKLRRMTRLRLLYDSKLLLRILLLSRKTGKPHPRLEQRPIQRPHRPLVIAGTAGERGFHHHYYTTPHNIQTASIPGLFENPVVSHRYSLQYSELLNLSMSEWDPKPWKTRIAETMVCDPPSLLYSR